MNFCSNCGNKLSYNSQFCPECGSELNRTSKFPEIKTISKKTWIGIGIFVLILLVVVLPIRRAKNNGPEKVVYNCMQSFYKGDIDFLLQHVATVNKIELLEDLDYGYYTKREMQDELRYASSELVALLGPNWPDKLKLEVISQDKNTAVVRVFYHREFLDVQLIKENKTWKVFEVFDY